MTPCAACGEVHDGATALCPRLGVAVSDGPCGARLERYDVERYLGGGGFGAVYAARHAVLGQAVALKLLRREVATSAEVVARFLREARAAASIDSAHVVRVTDFGTTADGLAFFVMELLVGRDLDAVLREQGVLPVPRAVELALQILDGLAAAHAAGVVHRDVKPANVVFAAELGRGAERDHVKVVDFGLSKVSFAGGAQQLTLTGAVIGTPHYMPPEQFRGAHDVDARADVYATGVILYRMLSGELPYDAPSYPQLLLKLCTEPPRPLREAAPALPRPIVDVVERAIAADVALRFPTSRAFAEALRCALAIAEVAPTEHRFGEAAQRAESAAQHASSHVAAHAASLGHAPTQPMMPAVSATLGGAEPRVVHARPTSAWQLEEPAPPEPAPRRSRAWLLAFPLALIASAFVAGLAGPSILARLSAFTATPPPRSSAPVDATSVGRANHGDAAVRALEPSSGALGVASGVGAQPPSGAVMAPLVIAPSGVADLGVIALAPVAPSDAEPPRMVPMVEQAAVLGVDADDLRDVEEFGGDPAQAAFGPIGEGGVHVAQGMLIGSQRADVAGVLAEVRAALPRIAECRAPADASEAIAQLIARPGARTPYVQILGADASTARCLRNGFRGTNLAPHLPARTTAMLMLTLELPPR